jgi:hypothetical protein
MNPVKFWLVIKDDSKRTFEVIGQERNTNAFTNKSHAMQRVGMNVTAVVLPVTGKNFSKDVISFIGYEKEDGLYERLDKQLRDITLGAIDESDFDAD